jgi:two-component system sensor histidine kinase PilS (NtrC family)
VDNSPERHFSAEFKDFFLRFSVIRLGIMVFILVLAISELMNLSDPEMRLQFYRDRQYIFFFVVGFGLSIYNILSGTGFIGSFSHFRFQLFADIVLITWWVLLTGGSFSGFVFLYLLCLFFYGRMTGFLTILMASLLVWVLLFAVSCIQFYYPMYWDQVHIRGSDLAYNYSLMTLALILVASLVRISRTTEKNLLHRVVEQEKALRQAEELKYKVFDWIDAGLILVNRDARITSINQKALDCLSGLDRNSVIGRDFSNFFPEFLSFWTERSSVLPRNMVKSADGQRVFGFKMTELPENQGWMILFSDITEFQRLEKQVKEMEKLATVGELAAGLAHEMKNPLAGIKTSLQLLLSNDLEKQFAQRLSNVILRDIDRLDFLLKDFLVFARPQLPNPEPLDLDAEIRHILMPLRLQYPLVRIEADLDSEPYHFDRNQFHQIMINLLVNAFQALEGRPKPTIRIFETRDSQGRTLVVADNGPGLDDKVLKNCFDPFVTTKPVGTGLGLSIARRLAAQNKTFIELVNNPEGGARALLVQSPSFFRIAADQEDIP